MKLNYEKNIPLLYAYSIFIKRVSQPIIIIYFLLNTLNYTQIGILAAIMSIVTIILEVPGGIFADSYGKKLTLIISSFFGLLTMLFYYLGNSFIYFLIAAIFYGISGAFITGTRGSLMYDSLLKLKKEKSFKKYNGKMLFYSHIINGLILLCVPWLYTINNKLPFLIGIFFFIISIILALLMVEPKLKKHKISISEYYNNFLDSIKQIFQNKKLFSIFFFSAIFFGFTLMNMEFTQPLLLISGLDVIYFGIIYCLFRVLAGTASIIAHKFEKYITSEKLMYISGIILLLCFIGFGFGKGIILILGVIFLRISVGMNRIIVDDEIHKKIESHNRTTLMSLSNVSKSLVGAIMVFIAGILADIFGVQPMYYFIAPIYFILIFMAALSIKKHIISNN